MSADYERLEIRSRQEWRRWLRTHHDRSPGVWLVTFHKSEPQWHVSYGDVVDEAIAFGWVDSLPRKLDDHRSQLLVTPRKPRSSWSRVNKQRVERLERAGLMTEAGRRAVAAARANGAWAALDQVEQLVEPDELRAALRQRPDELGPVPPVRQARHPGVDRQRQEARDPHQAHHGDRAPGSRWHPRQSTPSTPAKAPAERMSHGARTGA